MSSTDVQMKQRVTQSDIARAAGVHNTTVSLCLRNSPSIPESTRKRIRAIADQMGYYPDPTLQALVAYRKGLISDRPKETLGYVTNWNSRWGWRAIPAHEQTFLGAQRKAAELGYQLEHFWLREPGMTPRRLSGVLYHRNITGMLLASHDEYSSDLSEIDWSRLSAVKIGCFPDVPALHRVLDDHSSMIRLTIQRTLAAGYERVGFVMAQEWDDLADLAWSSGFLTEQRRMAANKRIPILRLEGSRQDWSSTRFDQSGPADTSALRKWYNHHRPDVIVGFSPAVLGQIERLGLTAPRDVGYVELDLTRTEDGVAGVRLNREIAGEVATAMLIGQLQQNLRGLPNVATTTLVEGTWVDGASLAAVQPFKQRETHVELIESALLASA